MEAFDGRPLQRVLVRGRFHREPALRSASLVAAAGRWLRVLHDTPVDGRPARQQTRQEIVDAFTALGAYLAPRMTAHDVDAYVGAGVAAASILPDRLPMVVSHGDFAPRNILVDGSGRVAVIDLLARWQAPPYEDLAGFLVALHTSRANAVTRGVVFGRALERLEPAFLAGYFGSEAVPRSAIDVYELLLVLDRWAARANREAQKRPSRSLRERAIDAHFAARSHRLAVGLRQGT
jgi:aminoglycoside phosphotransferase (APT) family kinase protein